MVIEGSAESELQRQQQRQQEIRAAFVKLYRWQESWRRKPVGIYCCECDRKYHVQNDRLFIYTWHWSGFTFHVKCLPEDATVVKLARSKK